MFCHNCGTKLNEHDRFCFKCGVKVIKDVIENQNRDIISKSQPPSAQAEVNNGKKTNHASGKEIQPVELLVRDKFALLGFVLSFFFVFGTIPSIIFSVISLKRLKGEKGKGKGLALTGLIISAFVFVVFVFWILKNYIETGNSSTGGIV